MGSLRFRFEGLWFKAWGYRVVWGLRFRNMEPKRGLPNIVLLQWVSLFVCRNN